MLGIDAQEQYQKLSTLSLGKGEDVDHKIEGYMYEAFRLSDGLKAIRIAKNDITVDSVKYKPGDVIVIPLVSALISCVLVACSKRTTGRERSRNGP